jgi:hypothetical protein
MLQLAPGLAFSTSVRCGVIHESANTLVYIPVTHNIVCVIVFDRVHNNFLMRL